MSWLSWRRAFAENIPTSKSQRSILAGPTLRSTTRGCGGSLEDWERVHTVHSWWTNIAVKKKHNWLVVWNIFYFPIYWEFHHPNWRSYFSEGWPNHQPAQVSKGQFMEPNGPWLPWHSATMNRKVFITRGKPGWWVLIDIYIYIYVYMYICIYILYDWHIINYHVCHYQ